MTRLIFILTFLVSASWTTVQSDKLFVNYKRAIKNESTFQYFLVIKIKDLNTGESREICTKGQFLHGALHRELGLGYDDKSSSKINKFALSNQTRYFEFKNKEALNNLGLDSYSMDDLREFQKREDVQTLEKKIMKGWTKEFKDDKEMLLYAHTLFNLGILTGENNCFGGTLEKIE